MLNSLKFFIAAALFVATTAVSHAATVASFGTGTSGTVTNGTFTSSLPVLDTNNDAYFQGATIPASNWVWPVDPNGFVAFTYTFSFDLTGYNLNTASLNGLWGIDNIGSVALNGNTLSTLPLVVVGNFSSLTAYIANSAALFNQGLNSLVFSVSNQGGPGGFRATGTVTADLSAVPVPAALPLLASSLGALSFISWRRKRKAAKVTT